MRKILVDDEPRLCLFAIRDLEVGEELEYDYGKGQHAWRKADASKHTRVSTRTQPRTSRRTTTEAASNILAPTQRNVSPMQYSEDNMAETTISKCTMLLMGANTALYSDHNNYRTLRELIVSKIRNDRITEVVENDDLIMNFGSSRLGKIGQGRRHYIAQSMRQLGRLIMRIQEMKTMIN